MKRKSIAFALLLLTSPFCFATDSIRFSSSLLFRFYRQEFPQTPVPREKVDRYYVRWRPALLFQIHPSLQLGVEAEANWIEESDEDVRPPRFPEFHTPTFDRDNFKRDSVVLSRAFLRYAPSPNFSIVGGKFDHPFFVTELVWDDDLRPNGVAGSFSWETENGSMRLTARAGDFFASHYQHDRINVVALQGVFQAAAGILGLTGAISYYDYQVDKLAVPLLRTNTRLGPLPANDYNLVDFIGRMRLNAGIPFTAQIDYVTNTAADMFNPTQPGNGHQGYMMEVSLGQLENNGKFRLGLAYHHVESDAVLAAYNTDEWWFPTRGEGYRIHAGVRIATPLTLHASYLNQTFIDADPEFQRWLFSAEFNWP